MLNEVDMQTLALRSLLLFAVFTVDSERRPRR